MSFNNDGSNELMLRTLILLVMADILVDVQQMFQIVGGHFQLSPKVSQKLILLTIAANDLFTGITRRQFELYKMFCSNGTFQNYNCPVIFLRLFQFVKNRKK